MERTTDGSLKRSRCFGKITMRSISFISLSSALMWTVYANLIPQVHGQWESVRSWLTSLFHIQDKETGGLLQSVSRITRAMSPRNIDHCMPFLTSARRGAGIISLNLIWLWRMSSCRISKRPRNTLGANSDAPGFRVPPGHVLRRL